MRISDWSSDVCSSDLIGRRKPIVFASSIVMGAALTVPLFLPSLQGMLIYAALIGIGYGAFMSVDMALMTQVLPKADGEATGKDLGILRSEEHTSELQSLMRNSYAVFCLKKKKNLNIRHTS